MNNLMLMAGGDSDVLPDWVKSSVLGQVALVLGAIFFVVLVVFIWAAFWRKPRHQHHSHHRILEDGGLPARHKRRSALVRWMGRKRHKRRHHRERPANPTLAEIGGLPPNRDENPPS
jgi:hypothetical protein